MQQRLVIIGGGHAAAQLCGALSEGGYDGAITLVSEEAVPPYHRPPLSKAYLKQDSDALQSLRGADFFALQGITLQLGDAVDAIDTASREVRLHSGSVLGYDRLVIATGARPRHLPGLAEGMRNVVSLRSAGDAQRLRTQLAAAERIVVIGGGFIGLELAATARGLGKHVTVIEAAPRLLARAVSPEISAHVAAVHRAAGIDVRLDARDLTFEAGLDDIKAVNIGMDNDSERLPTDLLVIGIGAVPETRLAEAAGLVCRNGIVVDAHMQTSDDNIYAIGDCASFPYAPWGTPLRLESVQNAHDQARTAAASLLGTPTPYVAVPWFWSEQGAMRLQMTGLARPDALRVRRDGATAQSFSILHYEGDRLVCVESVNAPMDHLAAKKLLDLGRSPAPEVACDAGTPLKAHTAA